MFYLVYDPTTFIVYGFFHNEKMADSRVKDLKKTNPDATLKVFPYNMNVYISNQL